MANVLDTYEEHFMRNIYFSLIFCCLECNFDDEQEITFCLSGCDL